MIMFAPVQSISLRPLVQQSELVSIPSVTEGWMGGNDTLSLHCILSTLLYMSLRQDSLFHLRRGPAWQNS